MHAMSPINSPTFQKNHVLSNFFELDPKTSFADPCYFTYFENQIRLIGQDDNTAGRICTPQNSYSMVRQLKAGLPKEDIKNELALGLGKPRTGDIEKSLDSAVDLIARLYLMVHIGTVSRGITAQKGILWRDGRLIDALGKHFQHQIILANSVKLERIFNLQTIDRIADVNIQWTPNLVDHLRFIEDGKKPVLNVFPYAGFLQWQKENPIYPPELIQETLLTLALLLPRHSLPCRKWYLTQAKTHNLSPLAIEIGHLKLEERQIAHFRYWHDRLVVLKQYFDESKPKTIKQWWYDDRERVQWFWVAIVLVAATMIFGLIQCFEGGWQIWKAYHPE